MAGVSEELTCCFLDETLRQRKRLIVKLINISDQKLTVLLDPGKGGDIECFVMTSYIIRLGQ